MHGNYEPGRIAVGRKARRSTSSHHVSVDYDQVTKMERSRRSCIGPAPRPEDQIRSSQIEGIQIGIEIRSTQEFMEAQTLPRPGTKEYTSSATTQCLDLLSKALKVMSERCLHQCRFRWGDEKIQHLIPILATSSFFLLVAMASNLLAMAST